LPAAAAAAGAAAGAAAAAASGASAAASAAGVASLNKLVEVPLNSDNAMFCAFLPETAVFNAPTFFAAFSTAFRAASVDAVAAFIAF
jgi:hypothetical protein